MTETLYIADRISFAYPNGKEVLNDLNFSVHSGECIALIGPNGSGKSTLLKLFTGLLKPDAGTISYKSSPISKISQIHLARQVSYLPQEDEIHFPFSVREVVMLGRWPHSGGAFFDSELDIKICESAMKRVGIFEWKNRNVMELSGGERARVMLAKCLASEPECLLLDEPASELDLKHRAETYSLLKELSKEKKGVVVVAHDIGSASSWADRIVLLANGKIVAEGSPFDVLNEKILSDAYETRVKVISDGKFSAVFSESSGDAE